MWPLTPIRKEKFLFIFKLVVLKNTIWKCFFDNFINSWNSAWKYLFIFFVNFIDSAENSVQDDFNNFLSLFVGVVASLVAC